MKVCNGRKAFKRSTVIAAVIISLVIITCILVPSIVLNSTPCEKKITPIMEHSLLDYFNLTDGIDITWAHAVNSMHDLTGALNDSKIMMLEADVLMDQTLNVPIMAHPPAKSSDITLSAWIDHVLAANRKGIKLDFKETEVLNASLDILKKKLEIYKGVKPPVLLNADILSGPNNLVTKPVNSSVFINSSLTVDDVILSPGWTTTFKGNSSIGYTMENVEEMYNLVKDLMLPVTFPVRASLVPKSKDSLLWLLKQKKEQFSLTVWTSKKDKFNVTDLRYLRQYRKQVYYDLPEEDIALLR